MVNLARVLDFSIPVLGQGAGTLAYPSVFCGICLHLNQVFRIHLKILWNHMFYRISRFPPNECQVSHSGHVVMVER